MAGRKLSQHATSEKTMLLRKKAQPVQPLRRCLTSSVVRRLKTRGVRTDAKVMSERFREGANKEHSRHHPRGHAAVSD